MASQLGAISRTTDWTNTRLVCTQINAIFMWNPNMVMKLGILKKKVYVYDSSSALDSRSERVNNRDTINKCLMNVVSNPLDILQFSKYKQSDFNQSEHRNKVSLKCACIFNTTLEINLQFSPSCFGELMSEYVKSLMVNDSDCTRSILPRAMLLCENNGILSYMTNTSKHFYEIIKKFIH